MGLFRATTLEQARVSSSSSPRARELHHKLCSKHDETANEIFPEASSPSPRPRRRSHLHGLHQLRLLVRHDHHSTLLRGKRGRPKRVSKPAHARASCRSRNRQLKASRRRRRRELVYTSRRIRTFVKGHGLRQPRLRDRHLPRRFKLRSTRSCASTSSRKSRKRLPGFPSYARFLLGAAGRSGPPSTRRRQPQGPRASMSSSSARPSSA